MPDTNNSPACGQYSVAVINGVPTVQFDTAPGVGASIVIRSITGTINTSVPDSSITTAKINDGAVNEDKMSFDAEVNATPRFILIDDDGVATVSTITLADVASSTTDIRTNRLDQMAAPTESVSMNNEKIVSLAAGTASGDAVNKGQMDAAIAAAAGSTYKIYTSSISITDGTLQTYTPPNSTPFDILHLSFTSNGSTAFTTIPIAFLKGHILTGTTVGNVVYTNNGTVLFELTITKTATGLTMQRTSGSTGCVVQFTYITNS